MIGGAGIDSYDGGSGSDTVSFAGAAGWVIDLAAGTATTGTGGASGAVTVRSAAGGAASGAAGTGGAGNRVAVRDAGLVGRSVLVTLQRKLEIQNY